MASKANLVIDQGATFNAVITVNDSDGNPFDMEGYSGRAQLRKHYSSSNAVSFNVTLNTGQIELNLAANTTAQIVPGRYVYDVELFSGDEVIRIVEGTVNVTPEVTRPIVVPDDD